MFSQAKINSKVIITENIWVDATLGVNFISMLMHTPFRLANALAHNFYSTNKTTPNFTSPLNLKLQTIFLPFGVDFIIVQCTAFTLVDPESAQKYS
jgi:hypothetical protein